MVSRSLITGLTRLGVNFNYNPMSMHEVGDVIVVLAHVTALAQAIALKRKKPAICLLAGPNLMVWPTDDGGVLLSPEIDGIIVPSEPTRHMYAEIASSIKDRLLTWYAGVDAHQWKPRDSLKTKQVLVYWKNQQEGPALKNSVVELLKSYGWNPIVIEYGKYKPAYYKNLLNQVRFGVFLSRSESQGIALAEAWAMNVVTFPWNPKERVNRGRVYSSVSSCPYLTSQTGKDWKTIQQLELILRNVDQFDLYAPRQWVLDNMTDMISAQLLIDLIVNIQK